MRIHFVAGVLAIAGVTAGLVVSLRSDDGEVAAQVQHRRIMPGLAADSAVGPVGTPPTFDTRRWVRIYIRVNAQEIAATLSGTLPVQISAIAEARIPTVLEPPSVVDGTFLITPEGTDSKGCSWDRTITPTTPNKFKLSVFPSGDSSILASLESSEWFYTVTCLLPSGGTTPPIRSPAIGAEELTGFLSEVMQPYREGDRVRLPTQLVDDPGGCVKRSVQFAGSNVRASVIIWVYVYQPDFPGGCDLPIPPLPPPPPPDDDLVPLEP